MGKQNTTNKGRQGAHKSARSPLSRRAFECGVGPFSMFSQAHGDTISHVVHDIVR